MKLADKASYSAFIAPSRLFFKTVFVCTGGSSSAASLKLTTLWESPALEPIYITKTLYGADVAVEY